MTPDKEIVVLLFLKASLPGRVKTRLAQKVGAERATEIFRALVEHQIAEIPPDWLLEVHFDPPEEAESVAGWIRPLRKSTAFFAQKGADLGERLAHGFVGAFERHPKKMLIALGGDCPELTASRLKRAEDSCDADAVMIPALDGGYVALGLKRPCPQLFEGVDWGTGRVAAQTRQRASDAGLVLRELGPLRDVDHLEDLEALDRSVVRRFRHLIT